jgi:hypothetical protein
MLAGSAAVGQVTPFLFPMDQRGAEETLRGSLHGPMTLVASMFILGAMGFGANLRGRGFRLYSLATMAVLVLFGGLTASYIPRVAAGEPTPGMGVVERVNIYSYLLWVAALAISLWRLEGRTVPPHKETAYATRSRGTETPSRVLKTMTPVLREPQDDPSRASG